MRKEIIGNCELYLADNTVILADSFPLGKIDAVVTDPPYGLEGFSTSDFEMAWTSQNQAARRFKYSCGNERGFAPKSKEDREFINSHPTQKPIEVMKWCLSFLPKAEIILDPFMGSGSTGVACVNMGKKFIGVEIDEKYFDISCKRIEQAQKQGRMAI
jgi:DNA modification methylase